MTIDPSISESLETMVYPVPLTDSGAVGSRVDFCVPSRLSQTPGLGLGSSPKGRYNSVPIG